MTTLVFALVFHDISTYRKRAGRVTCCRPSPTTVKSETLVSDNPEQSSSPESLWVCLSLDLEHIQRQKNDFTNTNDRTSGRVHDRLAVTLAECAVKATAVVLREVVPDKWLAAKLVYSLEHLVWSIMVLLYFSVSHLPCMLRRIRDRGIETGIDHRRRPRPSP
jgi:hypothetical protein